MVYEIFLGNSDRVAQVSTDDDYNLVRQYSWTLGNHGYAQARIGGKYLLMHRVIMNPGPNLVVDHINHDKLDNRRENLRICTQAENMMNQNSNVGSSRFKGVSWNKRTNKFEASVMRNLIRFHLGYFDSEKEAARAYDDKARELFGEFARPNFPM